MWKGREFTNEEGNNKIVEEGIKTFRPGKIIKILKEGIKTLGRESNKIAEEKEGNKNEKGEG